MDRAAFDRHVRDCYGVAADHPWAGAPGYAVYRHPGSGKWFAVVMDLPGEKLELPGGSRVDALNLKCDPLLLGSLLDEPGFYPAYHMNKAHWITVALDGRVPADKLRWLVDISHTLTKPGA